MNGGPNWGNSWALNPASACLTMLGDLALNRCAQARLKVKEATKLAGLLDRAPWIKGAGDWSWDAVVLGGRYLKWFRLNCLTF